MDQGIDQEIALIILVPQTLLMPAKKEFVVDAALYGAWINSNPRQVSSTGVDGSTPGDICNAVSIAEPSSLVLIGIV